ncbi:MAG: hypothetical protein EON54_00235 [Alcaligenaceae bacterium]|nr:MAG: hypothetical protein EON54_00235 [Alcaligenaceae bacterium]
MSCEFIDFARAHGVEVDPTKLVPRDRIQRCGTKLHPRSTNGAYHWDGARGWAFAWDGDACVHWWNDPHARPWTEAEKAAWRAKRDAERQSRETSHRRAAVRAAEMLRTAVPCPHDYLFRKGLPDAQGLVLPDGALMVPMRKLDSNELVGAQMIRWLPDRMRWEKKMLLGMRAKGAVLRLGPRTAAETIFCEGFATGLSIELAVRQMRLSMAVLVCFSDANMVHVAGLLKSGRRYVFADNDKSGAGERAAKAMGLPYVMSPVEGEDANDFHVRAGLMAVCGLLQSVRKAAAGEPV